MQKRAPVGPLCSSALLVLASLFVALSACAGPTASPDAAPSRPAPSRATEIAPTAPARATTAAAMPAAPTSAISATAATLPGESGSPASSSDAGAPDASTSAAAKTAEGAALHSAEAAIIAADNKVKPPEAAEELQARARALFDAIVKDDPPLGDPFWFPKEPFIPLKDVKGPEKYWQGLHAAYAADIHKVHKKRKSWTGAAFKGFEIGSTPKWVKPSDEVNKIGYYRSFRGKLRYEIEGQINTIEVHTVISWQGRWYVTHLLKFKK